MLRKLINNRRRIEADDAIGIVVGIVLLVAFLLFGAFIILNIQKIAIAVVTMGIGILAMGAGVLMLKKGMEWMKKGA